MAMVYEQPSLVMQGAVLCPSSGEGLQPSKHSTFLSQLHPQLPLPTLEARTASSSSGGQPAHETLLGPSAARSPPLPHTWSLARLQYAAARTAVLHGPGTANAQQTMPSSTGHAARQLLSRSGRSSQLDRDAASVKRPKLEHTGSQGPEMAPGISMKQEAVDSGSSGPASQEGAMQVPSYHLGSQSKHCGRQMLSAMQQIGMQERACWQCRPLWRPACGSAVHP